MEEERFHRRIAELLEGRRAFVLAELVGVKGSSPREPGARMIIFPDSTSEGTIGGGTFEAEVLQDALHLMREGKTLLKEYTLTPAEAGMYCAGKATVFLQAFHPPPQLLIFGGGHIARALSRLAGETALFSITVIDDRPEFANPTVHPSAQKVILTDPGYEKNIPSVDENTYIVIVTRDHKIDKALVRHYCQKPVAYLGMVGSKSKWLQFVHELMKEGIPESALQRVYAPIGLPIGGKSPEEIAISILAQLIEVKNKSAGAEQNV